MRKSAQPTRYFVISEIRIQNFKSICDLTIKLGRVTVLIGENGSGKSNILEAIAFASGAAANKLDNDLLYMRGVRVTDDMWMRCAFPVHDTTPGGNKDAQRAMRFTVKGSTDEPVFECSVTTSRCKEDRSFNGWKVSAPVWKAEVDEALQQIDFAEEIKKALQNLKKSLPGAAVTQLAESGNDINSAIEEAFKLAVATARLRSMKRATLPENAFGLGLTDFIIYAPENTTLRTPPPESAIQPLGTKGEGLFKLLQSFTAPKFHERLTEMKSRLRLFGWFDDFLGPDDATTSQAKLQIRDRWLDERNPVFDQRSANEGFLYLLFYFTLLMSWRTPRFFALDNVDNALNPKLCSELMTQIVDLAKKNNKQVICTTHNPAILDGLDLTDEDQRLYTVRRNSDGHTIVRRIRAPQPREGEMPVRLSEAFTRGIIGGLPDHF
jgi:predicted ATPase